MPPAEQPSSSVARGDGDGENGNAAADLFVCVLAIGRDEHHILNEWIWWYARCLLADEIMIADDGSSPPMEGAVFPWVVDPARTRLRFRRYDDPTYSQQVPSYVDSVDILRREAVEAGRLDRTWVIICDFDEFLEVGCDSEGPLRSPGDLASRFRRMLEATPADVGSITAHWRVLAPAGDDRHPEGGLLARSTQEIDLDAVWSRGMNDWLRLCACPVFVKAITRLAAFDQPFVHTHRLREDLSRIRCACTGETFDVRLPKGEWPRCDCALASYMEPSLWIERGFFNEASFVHLYTQSYEWLDVKRRRNVSRIPICPSDAHTRERHEGYYRHLKRFEGVKALGDLFEAECVKRGDVQRLASSQEGVETDDEK